MNTKSNKNIQRPIEQPNNENLYSAEGKIYIAMIVRRSFRSPIDILLLLCPSNMNYGHSDHQNYVIQKLLPDNTPRIACTPDRYEALRSISEQLRIAAFIDVPKLVESFRNNSEGFETFYSTFIESLVSSDDYIKGINNEFDNLNLTQVDTICFLQYLQELSTTCKDICRTFVRTNPTLEEYATFWNEYSRVIMELEFCFAPLADALNTVITVEGGMPSFTICKLMKAIFFYNCYCPLEKRLKKEFIVKLKILMRQVGNSKGLKEKGNETQRVYLAFQGLVDMAVNELNVHFINTREYLSMLGNPRELQEIRRQLTECFVELCEEMKEVGNDCVGEIWTLYKKLFPVSFLEQVDHYVRDLTVAELKEETKKVCEREEMCSGEEEISEEVEELISSVLTELNKRPTEDNIIAVGTILERENPGLLRQYEELEAYESQISLAGDAIRANNKEMNLLLNEETNKLHITF